ncbi:MAG: DNA polymerase III subunit delta [Candidatus Dormibacteria bacterium]
MLEPLVLVHGDDPYLVTTAAVRIRSQLTTDPVHDLALEEFRGARDLDEIARSVATPPFLAIRRLVVIWDPPQLTSGQRTAKESEALGATLGLRLETTAVLVVFRGTVAPSSPLLQAVRNQHGEVRSLKKPKGRELRRYVEEEVRTRGLHLGQAVLPRLTEVAAQDLGRFHQELEKLDIYGAGQPRIADVDALRLVPPAPSAALYRLTDTLFEAPLRVGERLRDIAGRSDSPAPKVVGALAAVVRELIAFGDGRGPRMPPWKDEKLRLHLSRAGEPRLRRWLVQLADLDWSTRTGAVDGQEGLELLLAGMAAELRSQTTSRSEVGP